jgi:hypothetical protein
LTRGAGDEKERDKRNGVVRAESVKGHAARSAGRASADGGQQAFAVARADRHRRDICGSHYFHALVAQTKTKAASQKEAMSEDIGLFSIYRRDIGRHLRRHADERICAAGKEVLEQNNLPGISK